MRLVARADTAPGHSTHMMRAPERSLAIGSSDERPKEPDMVSSRLDRVYLPPQGTGNGGRP
jgi:hypothetical protein